VWRPGTVRYNALFHLRLIRLVVWNTKMSRS